MIARRAENAWFVLHLYHEHGAFGSIDLADMRHHGGKGARVAAQRLLTEDGDRPAAHPRFGLGAEEAPGIGLHPGGSIAREGILQRAEPEEDQVEIPLPRRKHNPVQQREVVLPLRGLDEFPRERDQHRVQVQFHQPVQNRLKESQAGSTGVMQPHPPTAGSACHARSGRPPGRSAAGLPVSCQQAYQPLTSLPGYIDSRAIQEIIYAIVSANPCQCCETLCFQRRAILI